VGGWLLSAPFWCLVEYSLRSGRQVDEGLSEAIQITRIKLFYFLGGFGHGQRLLLLA